MIALEFTTHWKTGKPKILIEEVEGINILPLKTNVEEKEKKEAEEINELRSDCIFVEHDEDGNIKKVKVKIQGISNYLIKKHNFKTIYGTKSEDVYVYEDGIYVKNGREIIQIETEKILEKYSTNHYIKEIEEKIKRLTSISKEKFDHVDEELICLENGVLNLKTLEFLKHNPKYHFKSKLQIEYNKKTTCPKIIKFLGETLYPEDIPVIQEWFGFNLYRKYFIKKALICFGGTDTGKTVLLNLLVTFIGETNCSGISLQRISAGDKFALASLKDKLTNVFDDLSSRDLSSGGFKIATGGGYITAEYKFGDSFQFLTYAKHTFAANKIPSIKEIDVDDKAYYGRWIPIPFDNQVEKGKQDRFLIEKITTKKELCGLLNWSLEGLKRLFENGKFSFDKAPEVIKTIMEKHGDSLSTFCQEVLIEKVGNKISKNIMFEIYSKYVNDKKVARLSKEQLGRRLEKYANYIIAKHDSKERYWENVDINPKLDNDTFDTFKKIYSMNREDIDYLHMYSGEVSKESQVTHKTTNIQKKYKVVKETPEFVKSDEKTEPKHYIGEIIELPEEIAKILISDGKIKEEGKKGEDLDGNTCISCGKPTKDITDDGINFCCFECDGKNKGRNKNK